MLRVVGEAGDPEVADGEPVVGVEQEVGRLDVAVHDPRRVGGVEAGRGLAQPAHRGLAVDRRVAVARRAQAVGDRPAAEVLHDDVGVVTVLAGVVDRGDVGVLGDARGRARLALEARAGAGIGGVLSAEHLDCDDAVQEEVLDLPDGRHPAAGDVAGHAVALGQLDSRGERHQ